MSGRHSRRSASWRCGRSGFKPGKPIVYGRIGACDLLGLPGNPVSALVTFCLFVRPFILRRLGATGVFPAPVSVIAPLRMAATGGRREFARARLAVSEDGEAGAEIHARQGSDVLSATAWATGLVEIAEGATVAPGDRVRYYSFRRSDRLMATVRIQEEPFDAGTLIAQTHRANPKVGAVASFIGLVRDVNEGSDVSEMTLEHYPGMTERAIENICPGSG